MGRAGVVHQTRGSAEHGLWMDYQDYIPHVRLGAAVRFKPRTIQQWLVQQEQAGRAERVPEVQV